ncbi:hypothetical protein HX824_13025 [Pseudomonas sp. D4002]|uniref:hypothetical protein n=1 Tax=Pseudomonas sp. D4002 TaxID=2738817 RepID=UPI0015A0DE09|nr:hypothetical protein [Pseudomonas sp. D4002]NWB21519.1 hypothetical protein [Pseudomonas sp. D4002]
MTSKYTPEEKKKLVELLGELTEPHISAFSDAFQRFGQWLQNVNKQYVPLAESFSKVNWKEVRERLDGMQERSSKTMDIAANQGWFFNWQDSLQNTLKLIDDIESAEDSEIDEILEQYYDENLDWFTSTLCSSYPARKRVIEAAVNAHKRNDDEGFILSIPVFLAQADGLFWEISGIPSPMSKVRGGGALTGSNWIKDKIGNNQRANNLLSPFFKLHDIDLLKSQSKRNKDSAEDGKIFNALNRHQVLHGEVSNYGTKINSLKAFSLVIFIGLHLPDILKRISSDQESPESL